MAEEKRTDEFRRELANLNSLTTECEKIFKDVLDALRKGKILPLCAQPLLQLHLEPVNSTSVIKMVEDRLAQMTKREIGVLVTGEFNAGKSTFVNIQMGGEYLPMDRGRVTHVVCEIRHCSLRLAILKFEDKSNDECITLHEDSSDSTWQELRECIKSRKYKSKIDENNLKQTRILERIIIYWPLRILEDIFEDGPLHESVEIHRRTSDFPKEFIDRLQRPHAESFKMEEGDEPRDKHETHVKEVRTSNDETTPKTKVQSNINVEDTQKEKNPKSKEIAIEQRTRQNNEVQINTSSVEHASDLAPHSYERNNGDISSATYIAKEERDKEQEYASDADIDYDDGDDDNDDDDDELRFTEVESQRYADNKNILQTRNTTDQTDPKQILQQSSPAQVLEHGLQPDLLENSNLADGHLSFCVRDFQFVLLDCPGIDLQEDDTDCLEYTGMIREVKNCQSFIFIIDASKDSGVKKRGVKALMTDIEKEFKSRNMNFNPDLARFVANKTETILDDKAKTADLKVEVLEKLMDIWPLVRKEHVIPFNAKNELENHINDQERRRWIREFFLFTIRITLEEHCIWLLRMLEIAHTLAKLGQKASPVVDKLDENLRSAIEDAMNLREISFNVTDKNLRKTARKELREILKRNEEDLKTITWEEGMIDEKIPNADGDWSELISSAYVMIGEKVEEKIMHASSELKKRHEQALSELYRPIDEKIKILQAAIFGLEEMKKEDAYLRKGVFALLSPVIISAGIRALPLVNPLVLMVAPLLPLGLFGKFIIDDIQETKNDAKRMNFKENKVEFMREETKRLVDIAINDVGVGDEKKSPLLMYFIGEQKNKIINIQIDQVIHVAELFQEMSCNESEECQKCAKRYVISMMKFYVEKVMKHEFTKKDDIIWIRNEEGNRRTIDQGANACTYEATLSGRFDYNKCVAVKEFKCKLDPSDNSTSLPTKLDGYRECFYLRQLSAKRHEKLVKFLGTGTSITDGFLNLRIVMERYIGDLKRHVISAPRSPFNVTHIHEFLHYAKQCTEGLAFIHENNVIHRDVKPSNFLITRERDLSGRTAACYSVVISDVGCAKSEKAICTRGQELGTCVYWAPEISLANTFHSKASDVFSLGLVLWELWTRQLSFNEDGRRTNLLKVVDSESVPFIKQCLRTEPRFRTTSVKLLSDIVYESSKLPG